MAQSDIAKLLSVKKIRYDKANRLLREAEKAVDHALKEVEQAEQLLEKAMKEAIEGRIDTHDEHFYRYNDRDELAQFYKKLDEFDQIEIDAHSRVSEAQSAVAEAETRLDLAKQARSYASRQIEKFSVLVEEEQIATNAAALKSEEAEAEEISELRYR